MKQDATESSVERKAKRCLEMEPVGLSMSRHDWFCVGSSFEQEGKMGCECGELVIVRPRDAKLVWLSVRLVTAVTPVWSVC